MQKNRIDYFDNIKFFLILLVVFGHMMEICKMNEFTASIRFFIYAFHMPVFIFVSGLFYDKNNIEKCRSRVMFFLSMYILMQLVSFISEAVFLGNYSFSLFKTGGMSWFMFAMAVWCALLTLLRKVKPVPLTIFFLILSLIIGYDNSIGDLFVLSRIIVFFPFFIFGNMVDKQKLMLINKKNVKVIAGIVFVVSFVLIVLFYNDIKWMEVMLSGRNSYSALSQLNEVGFIVRGISYLFSFVIGTAFILMIPCGKLPITRIGERSLGVYFWDPVLYHLQELYAPKLAVWQFLVCAIIITMLLSSKIVYKPFRKLMKVWG